MDGINSHHRMCDRNPRMDTTLIDTLQLKFLLSLQFIFSECVYFWKLSFLFLRFRLYTLELLTELQTTAKAYKFCFSVFSMNIRVGGGCGSYIYGLFEMRTLKES